MEEWRDVVGWEGLYRVSNHGQVQRVIGGAGTHAGRLLKPYDKGTGYWCVQLLDRGRLARCRVHRLVAIAFVAGAAPELDVHHKNGNKKDNRPENLEWCTRAEHVKHRAVPRKGCGFGPGELHWRAKLKEGQVRRIRRLAKETGLTLEAIGELFGVTGRTAGKIIRRERWKHISA